jgi:flagellar biosynthesis/type III secretory pathway chaperone
MLKEDQMNNLISVLEHEYKVYEDILSLSKQKTDIIIEGRVAELDNIVKLEQALVIQISRIDDQREQILNEMLPDKKDINMSELKKLANKEEKKRLEDYQTKLTDKINELRHTNQLNAKLIKNSLEYIEFSLNIMSNADVTSNNYGNAGDNSKKPRKNFFDMKL